jgi:hypothetical protein
MTFETTSRTVRLLRALRFGLLALVSLALAHEAIFAAQYGIGPGFARAMQSGGHDGYWPIFSVVVVVAATMVGLRAVVRLGGSGRSTVRHDPGNLGRDEPGRARPGYRRELAGLWLPLTLAVTVAFAVQENLEHFFGHGHLIGLGALTGPEYPLALPVLAVVSLLAAALGALVRWRIAVLEARRAGRAHVTRPRGLTARRPPPGWGDIAAIRALAWFLVRLDAGRAPPRAA